MVLPEVDPLDPPIQENRKPYSGTKHEVDPMTRCGDMAIRNFPKWRPAAILDLIKHNAIRPADTESPTYRTKHEVDLITRCGDSAIRNFPRWRPAASWL